MKTDKRIKEIKDVLLRMNRKKADCCCGAEESEHEQKALELISEIVHGTSKED